MPTTREQCRFCDLGHRGHRAGCPQVEIDALKRALAAEMYRAESVAARVDESLRNGWIDRDLAVELDRRVARAFAEGAQHGLLAAGMWAQGELDRYERVHGDLPVGKWPDLDRGYRLAVQNVLAALAVIDPARRAGDGETRFCAEEASRG